MREQREIVEIIKNHTKDFDDKMATKKYDDDQIVQMDKTPTPFDAQRKRTITPRGSKSVNSAKTGHSKGEMLDIIWQAQESTLKKKVPEPTQFTIKC